VETLDGLADGSLRPRPQDESLATHAPIIRKEDGRVSWDQSAQEVARRVRAFHPWPGSQASFGGRVIKIVRAAADSLEHGESPGTILRADKAGVLVACGHTTSLRLAEVQPESRKAMDAFAWAAGARLAVGQRFDP
jgi:methionyl-tRNA formyltransferase